jgi:glycerophosphoryl diester phosphodiesterase
MTPTILTAAGETPARVSLLLDGVERPARSAVVPHGARTVPELVSGRFPVAHRLSGAYLPEFSMRGATESVLRPDIRALEFSVASSSDGVLFGLHDETLQRTSGVDLDPRDLTWAEIQTHLNAVPAGGDPRFGPQPYLRLDEFLDTYGHSHVVFIDPKYIAGPQFYDLFYGVIQDALPGAQDSVVIKFFGDAASVANAATARGFASFGYFYQWQYAMNPGLTISQTAPWTMLGMTWDAQPETWTAFTALGKPIIAHTTITTPAQAATAYANGAQGLMVSHVPAVLGAPVI